VDGKRLFIGDRLGFLYCLDIETGQTIWKRETSDAPNRSVNATAIVVGDLVITATNAGFALAFSVEDGQPIWQCKLDGPCTHHLFLVEKQIVAAAESLHFFAPATGELQGRVGWPGLTVAFAVGTPSQVALFRRQSWNERNQNDESNERLPGLERIFVFEGTRLIREIPCSEYASTLRFSPVTALLYASGLEALDILNPKTGEWLHTLRSDESTLETGLPDVTEDRIYSIDGKGVVRALRHPVRP
jgi:hypothetical protein